MTVKTSNSGPSLSVEYISPEIAKDYLASNAGNRRLSETTVLTYKNEMLAGRWDLGPVISFDVNGKLLDGQHRLSAVVSAGIIIPFIVLRDLPPQSATRFDVGKNRNASDIAQISGHQKVSAHHTQICKYMFSFSPGIRNRLTKPVLAQLTVKHFDAINFIARAQHRISQQDYVKCSVFGAVAVRAYYTRPNDREKIRRFMALLSGGPLCDFYKIEGEVPDGPIQLRSFYTRNKACCRQELFFKAQTALSYFLEGKKMRNLVETKTNLFPIPEIDEFHPRDEIA